MLGTYTYHEIIRKTVVGFGTLFNNIELRRTKGSKTEVMKVPLAYGPKQKFLARLRQVGDLSTQDQAQITLPRVSFEIGGISYDPTRKLSPISLLLMWFSSPSWWVKKILLLCMNQRFIQITVWKM